MTITASAPFKAAPSITERTWINVLEDAGSLASDPLWDGTDDLYDTREDAARHLYRFIVQAGHDPARFLAIMGREHQFGTDRNSVLWRNNTQSATNARSVQDPRIKPRATVITDSVRKSGYVKYANIFDSIQDGIYRVDDPTYAYADAVSISDVIHIWTESEGDTYTAYVVTKINLWADMGEEPPMPERPKHVALSAGHRNTSGGDAHEREQTAVLTPALAVSLRAAGFDVRVVQGNDGRDMFPGGLHDVARTWERWDAEGWTVDCAIEVHTQGGPKAPGMFVIYPDKGGDMDADVRDTLGPAIIAAIEQDTALRRWSNGLMPESRTGVGSNGDDRLGIFNYSQSLKDHAERMIIEVGAHDVPSDLAIVDAPAFPALFGGAVARALAAYYGVTIPQPQPEPEPQTPPPAAPDPNAQFFSETGFWVVNDGQWKMLDAWTALGGIATCGYPQGGMTGEGRDDGAVEQIFDNVMIELYPNGTYRLGGLGMRYVALKHELEAA